MGLSFHLDAAAVESHQYSLIALFGKFRRGLVVEGIDGASKGCHVVAEFGIAKCSPLHLVFKFGGQFASRVQIDEFFVKFVIHDVLSMALPSLSRRALRPR